MTNAKHSELRLDFTGLMTAGVGDAGVTEADLDRIADRAAAAVDDTRARRAAGEVGFLDLPDDRAAAREAMDWARALPPEVDTVVVIGIGGSSLGGQALYTALARPLDPLRPRSPGMPRRLLFPDNADPETFAGVLAACPLERTVFDVVTKSGTTAETAAQLLVITDRIERALGADALARHVVVTTDPERGALRELANQLGLRSFPVPPNVGGRFSALSHVGLIPAAAAGLDVTGLLEGAARMRDRVIGAGNAGDAGDAAREVRKNPALLMAALAYLHHTERGRPMTVMMPYGDALSRCADWFRQLWAESLGKARDRDGNTVNVGPTPISARGATDQHSLLQLFAEGPDDKIYLVAGAREHGVDLVMPAGRASEHAAYSYLAGRRMGELLAAELAGTCASLLSRKRPLARITLERVTAGAIGELLLWLEATTAFAGSLYGIDPYDQPGVEEAKRLAYGALGREGYEDDARALERVPASDPRYVL